MAVSRGARRIHPVLAGRQDSDREALDELTRRLRERLLEPGVDGVGPVRSGDIPAGAEPVDAIDRRAGRGSCAAAVYNRLARRYLPLTGEVGALPCLGGPEPAVGAPPPRPAPGTRAHDPSGPQQSTGVS